MNLTRALAMTDRDRQIVRAAWSLGYATSGTLRRLVSPETSADTFTRRLKRLRQHGHLVVQRYVAPDGGLWLYGIGPVSLPPDEPPPWRPSLAQVQHTLDVGTALAALTRPRFAHPVQVTAWQGESELRAWALPGAPFPDAAVTWRTPDSTGRWLVEVDRATESRAAWRRKLVRHLTGAPEGIVLALTTSHARATHLAAVAADVGVPVLSTTLAAAASDLDPPVLDTRTRRRLPLSQTIHPAAAPAHPSETA